MGHGSLFLAMVLSQQSAHQGSDQEADNIQHNDYVFFPFQLPGFTL